MTWVPTTSGHELTIGDDGKIVARNSSGRVLASVPPAAKKTETFGDLDALLSFLHDHDAEVGAQVATWVLRSLPVPRKVIAAAWADETWRSWLVDLVVASDDDQLEGFLRGADDAGLHIVDLDGESTTITAERVAIPHPVVITDLDDVREFAVELGVSQRMDQLFREVHRRDRRLPETVTELNTWSGGVFEQLRFAAGRAISAGYKMSGGYATVTCIAAGNETIAQYWIGTGYGDEEAETGGLHWVRGDSVIPVANVDPIAYSEGVRMASHVFAGRKVEEPQ